MKQAPLWLIGSSQKEFSLLEWQQFDIGNQSAIVSVRPLLLLWDGHKNWNASMVSTESAWLLVQRMQLVIVGIRIGTLGANQLFASRSFTLKGVKRRIWLWKIGREIFWFFVSGSSTCEIRLASARCNCVALVRKRLFVSVQMSQRSAFSACSWAEMLATSPNKIDTWLILPVAYVRIKD